MRRERKSKEFGKRLISLLVALALVIGSVDIVGGTQKVSADSGSSQSSNEKLLSTSVFLEKEAFVIDESSRDAKRSSIDSINKNGLISGKATKINYGTRIEDGKTVPQPWYFIGLDENNIRNEKKIGMILLCDPKKPLTNMAFTNSSMYTGKPFTYTYYTTTGLMNEEKRTRYFMNNKASYTLWKSSYSTEQKTDLSVLASFYGGSSVRNYLTNLTKSNNNSIFTDAEKNRMQTTTHIQCDTLNGFYGNVISAYALEDYLYLPYGVSHQHYSDDFNYNSPDYAGNKIWVGSNAYGSDILRIDKGISLLLKGSLSSGDPFWLSTCRDDDKRSAFDKDRNCISIDDGSVAMIAIPGQYNSLTDIIEGQPKAEHTYNTGKYTYNVVPAFNLKMDSILFASVALPNRANSTLDDAFTLRYDGSTTIKSTVKSSCCGGINFKKNSADSNLYAYVQGYSGGKNWVYSKAVTGDTSVTAAEICSSVGVTSVDLSKCKIWLETTSNNLTYAKEFTADYKHDLEWNSKSGHECKICKSKAHEYDSTGHCRICGVTRVSADWDYTFVVPEDLTKYFSMTDDNMVPLKVNYGMRDEKNYQHWYVAGADTDDNLVLVCDPEEPFRTMQYWPAFREKSVPDWYGKGTFETYSCVEGRDHGTERTDRYDDYLSSFVRAMLTAISVQKIGFINDSSGYFTSEELDNMMKSEVYTQGAYCEVYLTSDKLYLPESTCVLSSNDEGGKNAYFIVGKNEGSDYKDGIKVSLKDPSPYSSASFYTRSACPMEKFDGMYTWDVKEGKNDIGLFNEWLDTIPAFKVAISSVLFASSVTPTSYSSKNGYAYEMTENGPLSLRFDGKDLISFDSGRSSDKISVKLNSTGSDSTAPATLIIQGKDSAKNKNWVYYQKLTADNSYSVTADTVKNSKNLSDVDFSECRIWVEVVKGNVEYAKYVPEVNTHRYNDTSYTDYDNSYHEKKCYICGEVEKEWHSYIKDDLKGDIHKCRYCGHEELHSYISMQDGNKVYKSFSESCSRCGKKNFVYSGITVSVENPAYIGQPVSPLVTVKNGSTILEQGKDYTISVTPETDRSDSDYSLTLTGIGNYDGARTVNWNIEKTDPSIEYLDNRTPDEYVYDGKVKSASVELKSGYSGLGDITVMYQKADSSSASEGQADTFDAVPKASGTYDYYITISEGQNYKALTTPTKAGSFVIRDASTEIQLEQDSYSLRITDNSFNLNAAPVGIVEGDTVVLTYESNDTDVVAVSNEGEVTVKGVGTAKITVTLTAENYIRATEYINVSVEKNEATIIAPDSVEGNVNDGELDINATKDSDGEFCFSSSDEAVVSVDENGHVTVNGAGKATIRITTEETATYKAAEKEIAVTVAKNSCDISISYNVSVDDKFIVAAESDSDGEFTYTSSDENVVTVDQNGFATAVGAGEAVITVVVSETATYYSAENRTVKVRVSKKAAVISIPEATKKITLGAAGFKVAADTNSDGALVYTSSDEAVVTVDQNGLVKAAGVGDAVITVSVAETALCKAAESKYINITVEQKSAEQQGGSQQGGSQQGGSQQGGSQQGGSQMGGSQMGGSQMIFSPIVVPETGNIEIDKSETDKSETDKSETDKSETDKSETGKSETGISEPDSAETGEADMKAVEPISEEVLEKAIEEVKAKTTKVFKKVSTYITPVTNDASTPEAAVKSKQDNIYRDTDTNEKITNSFVQTEKGAKNNKTVFVGEDGKAVKNSVISVVDETTGTDATYVTDKNGVVVTNRVVTLKNGKRVFATENGVLARNEIVTAKNGYSYYTNDDGVIVTQKVIRTEDGKKYYANKYGVLKKNALVKDSKGKQHYCTEDGSFAVSTWVTVGNKKYWCNKSGNITVVKKIKK